MPHNDVGHTRSRNWLHPSNAYKVVKQARAGYKLAKGVHKAWEQRKPAYKSGSKRTKRPNTFGAGGSGSTMKQGIGKMKSSRSRVGRKTLKKYKKKIGIGRFRYTEEQQGTMTSSTGQQGSADILAYGTSDQILSNSTSAGPAFGVSNLGYFSLNPNDYLTGSQLFAAGFKPANDRIFLKSMDFCMKLTNMESAACDLSVYFVQPKQTALNNFPAAAWDVALAANSLGTPVTGFPAAGTTGGVGGYGSRYVWGEKPFSNPTMRQNFKLLKKFTMQMAGGSTEDITFNYVHDRIIKKDVIATDAAALQKNLTICVFYVIHGQVVIDKTAGVHLSTLALSEVAWVSRVTTTLSLLKEQVANVDADRIDVTIPANATLANQYQINEVDVVAPVTQA